MLDRLWLWRRNRTLADTPSWRLMQELRRRGDLRDAPASEAGNVKGTTGRLGTEGGYAVDSRGVPLLQQMTARIDGSGATP